MQDDIIMYVRNRKAAPVGVTYFKRTGALHNGAEIVVMGWSKACKSDMFTKKFGRNIAIKRATKAGKWVKDNNLVDTSIRLEHIADTNLPFIIKQNLTYFLETAYDGLGIEGSTIIVIPIIEKYVDVSNVLKDMILDGDVVNTRKNKVTAKTRYITLQYK